MMEVAGGDTRTVLICESNQVHDIDTPALASRPQPLPAMFWSAKANAFCCTWVATRPSGFRGVGCGLILFDDGDVLRTGHSLVDCYAVCLCHAN